MNTDRYLLLKKFETILNDDEDEENDERAYQTVLRLASTRVESYHPTEDGTMTILVTGSGTEHLLAMTVEELEEAINNHGKERY